MVVSLALLAIVEHYDGTVRQLCRWVLEAAGEEDVGGRARRRLDGSPEIAEGALLDNIAAEEQGDRAEKDCLSSWGLFSVSNQCSFLAYNGAMSHSLSWNMRCSEGQEKGRRQVAY